MTQRLRFIRPQAAAASQSPDPETPHYADEQHHLDMYVLFWNPVFQEFFLPLSFRWQPLCPQ